MACRSIFTTVQKPIDITKYKQNALQLIDIYRKSRKTLVNELSIITADINARYRQPLIHQIRSAITDSYDALLT